MEHLLPQMRKTHSVTVALKCVLLSITQTDVHHRGSEMAVYPLGGLAQHRFVLLAKSYDKLQPIHGNLETLASWLNMIWFMDHMSQTTKYVRRQNRSQQLTEQSSVSQFWHARYDQNLHCAACFRFGSNCDRMVVSFGDCLIISLDSFIRKKLKFTAALQEAHLYVAYTQQKKNWIRPNYICKSGWTARQLNILLQTSYSLLQCIRTKFSLNNLSYINDFTNLTRDLCLVVTFLKLSYVLFAKP